MPAILGASTWSPVCNSNNIGILYPDYNDNAFFYECVSPQKDPAHTKCGVVDGVQQEFVYIYQFCVGPEYYIQPPTSDEIDKAINGGNTGGTTSEVPNPSQSTKTTSGLPTPQYESTIGKSTTKNPSTNPTQTTPDSKPTPPSGSTHETPPQPGTAGTPAQPGTSGTPPPGPVGHPTPPGPKPTSQTTTSNVPMPPTPPPTPPGPPTPPDDINLSTPPTATQDPPQPPEA